MGEVRVREDSIHRKVMSMCSSVSWVEGVRRWKGVRAGRGVGLSGQAEQVRHGTAHAALPWA